MSQLMIYQSIKLIHRVSYENEPPALTQYLHHDMVRSDLARQVRKPSMTKPYKSSKMKNTFFYRSIFIYNNIPDNVRLLPKNKFNNIIKKYVFENYNLYQIPKIPDA